MGHSVAGDEGMWGLPRRPTLELHSTPQMCHGLCAMGCSSDDACGTTKQACSSDANDEEPTETDLQQVTC